MASFKPVLLAVFLIALRVVVEGQYYATNGYNYPVVCKYDDDDDDLKLLLPILILALCGNGNLGGCGGCGNCGGCQLPIPYTNNGYGCGSYGGNCLGCNNCGNLAGCGNCGICGSYGNCGGCISC